MMKGTHPGRVVQRVTAGGCDASVVNAIVQGPLRRAAGLPAKTQQQVLLQYLSSTLLGFAVLIKESPKGRGEREKAAEGS